VSSKLNPISINGYLCLSQVDQVRCLKIGTHGHPRLTRVTVHRWADDKLTTEPELTGLFQHDVEIVAFRIQPSSSDTSNTFMVFFTEDRSVYERNNIIWQKTLRAGEGKECFGEFLIFRTAYQSDSLVDYRHGDAALMWRALRRYVLCSLYLTCTIVKTPSQVPRNVLKSFSGLHSRRHRYIFSLKNMFCKYVID